VVRESPSLGTRLLVGAIAGFAATLPMTIAMYRLHRRLPEHERYPLTPRELIDATASATGTQLAEPAARDLTLLAHFLYGAGSGAVVAALSPRPSLALGAASGAAMWGTSYFGWIPALELLKPATEHPLRRDALMIAAHLVWGTATAAGIGEMMRARDTILRAGPDQDLPDDDQVQ
jgi:uncharacterized membrane protein YagU involved in acid resistance